MYLAEKLPLPAMLRRALKRKQRLRCFNTSWISNQKTSRPAWALWSIFATRGGRVFVLEQRRARFGDGARVQAV